MEENKLAIQNGLRTEIAEDFMNKMKDLFTESYITVPDEKVDLVDDLADQVEELEATVNESTQKAIDMAVELEGYKREAIIREATKDLAETQVEKLKSLAENVDFDDEETFTQKVAQLKESYFAKATKSQDDSIEEEDSPIIETTSDFFILKLISFKISSSLLDLIFKNKFFTSSKLLIIFTCPWIKSLSYNICK